MAETLAGILESYRGREKIMRLLQYTSLLAGGGLSKGTASGRFLIFAEVMSECRTVLRLFDELAMVVYARSYGLGKQEKDRTVRWTNLIDIFCGLTFYPLEHVAWARDKKLMQGKSAKLWDLGLFCWLGSLMACIVRDVWLLIKLHQEELECRKNISRTKSVDTSIQHSNSSDENSSLTRLHQIRSLQKRLLISVVGFTADLGNAVHWAPAGFLWSGKLPVVCVGLLGTVSSFSELYKYLKPAAALPSEALGSAI